MDAGVISIIPVRGIKLIAPGDSLGLEIVKAVKSSGVGLREGDIVVVSHVVVSKAEGRLYRLSELAPTPQAIEIAAITGKDSAHVEAVLRESK
ncbi:MAG: coenzyme F420-0:L-glutamate ligase, partial [Nitrososphaerota archaeon]